MGSSKRHPYDHRPSSIVCQQFLSMHQPDRPSSIVHRPSSAEGDDNPVVRFTDMAYGGDAVGRLGDGPGVVVFAWPGIEGELARVAVNERRKNLLRGAVTEVLEPSPWRVEPPCPYFGPCGGCQWQHAS